MRWWLNSAALLIAVVIGGCALIEAERDNRGGFLDQVGDDLWMKADSKKMRALRAVTIEASLARIAMIAPKSAPDRALLARRIGETTKRADIVRRCAFPKGATIEGQVPGEPCFFFDSVMVDYENALFDLALVALPIDDARNLLTRVTGGIASVAINPLELVQTLLDIGREAFRYGRVVGAIYRDTLELEVQVWLSSPEFGPLERARGVPEEFIVTAEKVAPLRSVYVRGNDNIPLWRGAIAALRAQGLEPVPHERFILQVYSILSYICGQIVTETDPAHRDCRQRELMQSVPVATGLGGGFLGPVVIPAGAGAGGGSTMSRDREQALREELRRKNEELAKLRQERRGASGRVEEVMPTATLLTYKRALCVSGPEATADTFDPQTRDRIREFVSGFAWAPAITGTGVIDQKVEADLKRAIKISPECSPSGLVASAYELGVYTRSGVQVAENEITNALKCLSLDSTLRGRRAFMMLRLRFDAQPLAQPAAAPVCPALPAIPASASGRDDLDPALWTFTFQKSVEFKRSSAPAFPR